MITFTRKELIELRDRAQMEASKPGLNPSLATGIGMLAVAADYLDAMIARTNVVGTHGPPLEIGKGCTAPDCECDGMSGCEKEMD